MATHVKKKSTDKPWFEIKFGEEIGRHPDEVSIEQLNSWGFQKKPILKVIRDHCTGCSGGELAEVRRCRHVNCPLWPYRMASNPFSERTGNPAFKSAQRMENAFQLMLNSQCHGFANACTYSVMGRKRCAPGDRQGVGGESPLR